MGPKERDLLKAAGKGDLETIKRLISEGADVSATNEEGVSPLTRAISRRHVKVVKYLLENGATVDYSGFMTEKPLAIAVKTGNVKLVEMVLDHGADIDETAAMESALSQAVGSGQDDIIDLLLKRGADANNFQLSVFAPLLRAVQNKNASQIKKMLKQGAETKIMTESLYIVLKETLPQSIVSLLNDWKEYGYEEQVRIIRDQSEENIERVGALVKALRCASRNGHSEIKAMFLDLQDEQHIWVH
jgi:ankyrin repeat protein